MPALCMDPVHHEPPITCVSTVPILRKMKVLKKFKKRIGLTSRNENVQLPPLLFHQVCGDNVRIERNGKVARRAESFCKGISFSNRPVKVGERIYVKLLEVSTNWSGVIRFGFTNQDPVGLRDALPKYACPDLTSKHGYWAKALNERFAEQGLVIFYYVTATGDVHFGVNGEEKGVFFTGVENKCPLWSMIDVYGNSTGIEFMDPLSLLNNRVRIVNDLRPGTTTAQSRILPHPPSPTSNPPQRALPAIPHDTPSGVETLQPSMAQLALGHNTCGQNSYLPLPFHRVRGRHAIISGDQRIVSRIEDEYSHGYVFTGRPLRLGERFSIRILETEPGYVGALAFGLTAANPAGLDAADLPEDCDLLLDRPEYWVVSKDVASSPVPGDELTFRLSAGGEVTYAKNEGSPQTVMHVDQSLHLWAFFDVYGNTKKIKMLGSLNENSTTGSRRTGSPVDQSTTLVHQRPNVVPPPAPLVVNLPPSPPRYGTLKRATSTHQTIVPNQRHTTYSAQFSTSSTGYYTGLPGPQTQHECTVCYEKCVDSVLYACGHMCMCFECAVQQWRGRGGGLCPICRAPIRDVIRTYRS